MTISLTLFSQKQKAGTPLLARMAERGVFSYVYVFTTAAVSSL